MLAVTVSVKCPRCGARPQPDRSCRRCGGAGVLLLRVAPAHASLPDEELLARYSPPPLSDRPGR